MTFPSSNIVTEEPGVEGEDDLGDEDVALEEEVVDGGEVVVVRVLTIIHQSLGRIKFFSPGFNELKW